MHGGVHAREVGALHGPRVARDGVRKKQLLDHDINRLAGCMPQPPDSAASHHLPQAAIVEGHHLCPLCLCEGP